MATAAAAGVASLRYFPSSLRNRVCPGTTSGAGAVTFSQRRGRGASAAAVAAPSREAEPASSLGDLTRVDFPILDQVSPAYLPLMSYFGPAPRVWRPNFEFY
jgi:cysteine desulfurase/selenocysteine lyase